MVGGSICIAIIACMLVHLVASNDMMQSSWALSSTIIIVLFLLSQDTMASASFGDKKRSLHGPCFVEFFFQITVTSDYSDVMPL